MLEDKDILKLAKLSRLELSAEDVQSMKGHLEKMLGHLDQLRSLDLSGIEPMTAVEEPSTALRPDVVQPTLSRELAFMNAPKVENDHFVIPKVIS